MADLRVSELQNLSSLKDDSLLVVEQDGVAYNITGALLKKWVMTQRPKWWRIDAASSVYAGELCPFSALIGVEAATATSVAVGDFVISKVDNGIMYVAGVYSGYAGLSSVSGYL